MKNKLKEVKKVYHGTICRHEESIKQKIDFSKNRIFTDFGQGFYTTTSYDQAKKWAKKQAKNYNRSETKKAEKKGLKFTPTKPIVLEYDLDFSKIEEIKNNLIFEKPDEKWSEFIFNNRVKDEKRITDFHNQTTNYDLIFGHMADSDIMDILAEIEEGDQNFEYFKKEVIPFKGEKDQLSFHTEDSLSCITYLKTHYP